MLRYLAVSILMCVFSSLTLAMPIKRVIYITFDGTRWQDVFVDRAHFKKYGKNTVAN